jgi:hypothetical protein
MREVRQLTCGFIHDQKLAPLQQSSSQGHQLSLSTGKVLAARSNYLLKVCEALRPGFGRIALH